MRIAEHRLPEDKEQKRVPTWIPLSDWLVIVAIIICLALVVAPLVSPNSASEAAVHRAASACSAAAIMIAGYVPSILAHYNFIYWLHKRRRNPTILELLFVGITVVIAALVYEGSLRWW